MTLKEHIDNIRERLEQNIFKGETAVRQGIVDPLLRSLGWPTDNTLVVFPEYPVGSGKVDYALCHPSPTPRVFIEAKQVGNIKGAEEQLFGYDSRVRVPIAVLTDGREWQFFHPTGEGTWAERKVCELDFIAEDSAENAERLNRYLNYESIRTGEAVEAIKKDYENIVQQKQVATRLPEAWSKLVQEADEFLVHAVAEKTESLCGHRPTDEQVLDFLKNLERRTESDRKVSSSPSIQHNPAKPFSTEGKTTWARSGQQKAKASPRGFIVIMPNDERIESTTSQDTFVETFLKLIELLGEEKVISADITGSCISTIPLQEGVRPRSYGKYFISTNHGTTAKKRLLDRIAERLGVRLKVEIIDKS